jgi:hypothetical protein
MLFLLQQYQEVVLTLLQKHSQEYHSFEFMKTLMSGLAGSASAFFTLMGNATSHYCWVGGSRLVNNPG